MVRTQIQLTEDQHGRLRALALRRGVSVAEMVRVALERVLEDAERENRWKKLWQAVGTCHDRTRARDVSRRHDKYLAEIYGRGRRLR